jgi:phosphoribosylformylglycinamidine (FGAM) synthase-like enzyme
MGQLVRAIQGLGEACRALDFPIVSGNVSLYNETNGQAILPTPAIGGVGLLADWRHSATLAFKHEGSLFSWRERRIDGALGSASRSTYAKSTGAKTARRRRSISGTRSASAALCAR